MATRKTPAKTEEKAPIEDGSGPTGNATVFAEPIEAAVTVQHEHLEGMDLSEVRPGQYVLCICGDRVEMPF